MLFRSDPDAVSGNELRIARVAPTMTRSTILTLTSERATGEAYCLAHHVTVDGDKRRLMVTNAFDVPSLVERCMVADQSNFRALGKAQRLRIWAWLARWRDLANGET